MINLTPEEAKYLLTVLDRTQSYTIARAEQIDHPSIRHSAFDLRFKAQLTGCIDERV